ncbi:DNA polymerase-3 subunit epsilon [Litorivivens lipolytica]|uniref:Excinuclease cho n=1 Tax=Litorivivens lipolytica TaxID=1524264 RepID=A0A7W4W6Z4_9GAMM|nr:3'-5' exonuclease family protein [Litorivivens lipolytica]MBB3048565.1 DNA polymerase-3 subunit epsilon [Litorivivens lipolytica]
MLLNLPLALLDLETTGGNPVRDRITEVGLCLWHDDGSEWYWESLVNPYTVIPEFIRKITGISQGMVDDAPGFEDLAAELFRYLEDCVLVAHNARFDSAFLRRAFEGCGYSYRPKVLCTLRLARKLYPDWPSHSLDNICRQIGYHRDVSHRAMADVVAMKAFLEFAIEDCGQDAVEAAVRQQWKLPSLPVHLSRADIDNIPDEPGVYRFYGDNGGLLYVGKSTQLRTRVLSHFNADHASAKEMKLAQLVRSLEWETTAGELGALLRENEQIKQLGPVFNRRQRRQRSLWYFRLEEVDGYLQPVLTEQVLDGGWRSTETVYGLYKTRKQAREALLKIATEHRLCQRRLGLEKGLEKGRGACFGYQLKRCAGACVGEESQTVYNLRLKELMSKRRLDPWPYEGPVVALEERGEQRDFHVIDYWAYLGTVQRAEEIMPLFAQKSRRFDWDSYKLLIRHLPDARVMPLSSFGRLCDGSA